MRYLRALAICGLMASTVAMAKEPWPRWARKSLEASCMKGALQVKGTNFSVAERGCTCLVREVEKHYTLVELDKMAAAVEGDQFTILLMFRDEVRACAVQGVYE
jgi:hypothetical protein